jgi:predicted glycogen debranching enzyme
MQFRSHDAAVDLVESRPYVLTVIDGRYEVSSDVAPPLRMRIIAPNSGLLLDGGHRRQIRYSLERARGYQYVGSLWTPGYFRARLKPGEEATLIASTEDWDTIESCDPSVARDSELERRSRLLDQAKSEVHGGLGEQLVFAADQFTMRPSTRVADAAMAQAAGDDVRSVIAGYHWFTDWGRDTFISLEGLTLVTGRHAEAGYLLRTFARYVRDGLIPNLFPEGQREGLYHTADATLWYFHALERYLRETRDLHTRNQLLPTLQDIAEHHLRGTRFGIHVDPADGLLTQGDAHLPLTWMDAKVGDWVVTPRRGKAVEINALWYNALRLLERWTAEAGDMDAASKWAMHALQTRDSFNKRFWFAEGNYLYDIVDGEKGDDSALRPNQLFAFSLDFPVLEPSRWSSVLDKVTEHLLTPVGLRSLAPEHPDYKSTYDGDLRARDAAYHQGTVWGWLIGPYVDAWLRVHPEEVEKARDLLSAFGPHLNRACIGSISEVFDAKEPFIPRGCIAQAWSVAEVLRAWVNTSATEED